MSILCSDSFAGRGYVRNGGTKASAYIASEFAKLGLKPNNGASYFQNFSHSVNTFPGKLNVKIDEMLLKAGLDYQVKPNSGSIDKSKLPILWLTVTDVKSKRKFKSWIKKNNVSNSAVAIEPDVFLHLSDPSIGAAINQNKFKAKCIIYVTNKKLTWSVSLEATKYPSLEIVETAISKNAKFIELEIEQKQIRYSNRNVIGKLEGKNSDSVVFITAHYDHLGCMGPDACFYGANDNASGTSMMLDFARHFAENQPEFDMVFIAFAGEEAGLLGSKYYVENPLIPLSKIKLLINLDLTSTGQDGIMVVNGKVFPQLFSSLIKMNEEDKLLTKVKGRGKAANSDHYWFSEKGVKAIFIYLLGEYPHYHDINDTPEKPQWQGYEGAFNLITKLISA